MYALFEQLPTNYHLMNKGILNNAGNLRLTHTREKAIHNTHSNKTLTSL